MSQWQRQRSDRRHDLIEQSAVELHESAGRLALQMSVDNVDQASVERVLFDTTVLVARARRHSPHLAGVLSELMDGLQDGIGDRPWRNTPQSPFVTSGLEVGEPHAWALSGAALNWLKAPDEFEARKPSAGSFLTAAKEMPDEGRRVPAGD